MSNRDRLLHSALDLFAHRGYDAVGVQEVCAAAAITKPTLYHYFGSKRGLLETLLRERYEPFLVTLAEAASYAGDLPRTLERVMGACFAFAREEPALWRLVLTLWFASPESEARRVVTPFSEEQRGILQQLFEEAARDHGNMRGRAARYATTLLGIIHTHVALSLAGELTLDPATMREVVHQFSHGIYS